MSKTYPCENCGAARPSHNPGLCRSCQEKRFSTTRAIRPSLVRNMIPEEAAWVGSAIQADGSVVIRVTPSGWWRPQRVCLYSTEVETIATILRLTGAGHVLYRKPRPNYMSPNGRQAFAKKDSWQWDVTNMNDLEVLLPQIRPYLTSKQEKVDLAIELLKTPLRAMKGGTCHPSHFEAGPDRVHNTEEDIERNWREFREAHRIDPRAIDKHFKFKPGHEPDFAEPESGEVYVKIEGHEGEESEPDQLHLLSGGEESGIPCEKCGTITRIAGEMSVWDIYHQPGVEVANLAEMTEARKRELQEQIIVVLACPQCHQKYQWFADALPARLQS